MSSLKTMIGEIIVFLVESSRSNKTSHSVGREMIPFLLILLSPEWEATLPAWKLMTSYHSVKHPSVFNGKAWTFAKIGRKAGFQRSPEWGGSRE